MAILRARKAVTKATTQKSREGDGDRRQNAPQHRVAGRRRRPDVVADRACRRCRAPAARSFSPDADRRGAGLEVKIVDEEALAEFAEPLVRQLDARDEERQQLRGSMSGSAEERRDARHARSPSARRPTPTNAPRAARLSTGMSSARSRIASITSGVRMSDGFGALHRGPRRRRSCLPARRSRTGRRPSSP